MSLRRRAVGAAIAVTVLAAVALLGTQIAGGRRSPRAVAVPVDVWETTGNASALLTQLTPQYLDSSASGSAATTQAITVDDAQRFQAMVGFGAAMTDSSAYVLENDLGAAARTALLQQMFSPTQGIGLDVLRVPIGATDFATASYSEDDVPPGRTDPTLAHFSIAHDMEAIVPVLRQALAINPGIEVIASPWSAPAWMKTTGSLIGGTLDPRDLSVYAAYLVKFVQAYAAQGIAIGALTMANEPDYSPTGYPGMLLSTAQEEQLAPILARDLAAAHLKTQILGFDSDWSDSAYAVSLLHSPAARDLAGIAFHCYNGDPSSQLTVHAAAPGKQIDETECSGVASYPNFAQDLVNGTETLVIDGIRDWSSTAMYWNLALDQGDGPTNGGCQGCVPNVTVNNVTGQATDNVEEYLLGQVSSFVQRGARRIASRSPAGQLLDVAFLDPDGKRVLVVLNPTQGTLPLTVDWRGLTMSTSIPGVSVQTYTWR